MRCIIHIGTEKTGSTAIQRYLFENIAGLRKSDGVHFCTSAGHRNNRALPAVFMSQDKSDDYIRRLKLSTEAQRKHWKEKLLDEFIKEVREAEKNSDVFLISSEHFHSRLSSVEEVVEVRDFLVPLFEDFRILCYLRRQDQMALSRYSEALRAGFAPESLLPSAETITRRQRKLPPLYDFQALLHHWASAFGDDSIRPRIYSRKDLLGGDVILDFLDAIGASGGPRGERPASNPALSAEAQAVLLSVNRGLGVEQRQQGVRLRTELVRYLEDKVPGKSSQPSEAEAQAFYELFRASNDSVARRFFGRDHLFEEDFDKYPAQILQISTDRVREILRPFERKRKLRAWLSGRFFQTGKLPIEPK